MKRIAFLMVAVVMLTACSDNISSQEEKAGHAATAFAEAYFNYNLEKARELTTPESVKWLSFLASNITLEDLEVLNARSEGASVALDKCKLLNDTVCEVMLEVENYMLADSIGRPGEIRDEGEYRLEVVLRNGKWLVRMEGLPQNEMHSRD